MRGMISAWDLRLPCGDPDSFIPLNTVQYEKLVIRKTDA
jgi:hypothetical protein